MLHLFKSISFTSIYRYLFSILWNRRFDPLTCGIPNICFSVKDTDCPAYKLQRVTRGFDNSEWWNLDVTICMFVIPRLVSFRRHHVGYPSSINSNKEWEEILDKMILGLKLYVEDDFNLSEEMTAKKEEGMKYFKLYFESLWD